MDSFAASFSVESVGGQAMKKSNVMMMMSSSSEWDCVLVGKAALQQRANIPPVITSEGPPSCYIVAGSHPPRAPSDGEQIPGK